ncbi:MAG: thioredoxin domain-containing protein [Rhodospirillaceae bacterium]|nr:thioredoxin domain-containing protein [Rhodospirillaceae bacterium]
MTAPVSDPDTIAANTLGDETSPYLLQHRDNPVHWQPWSEAAFAAAQDADKPVLLSIGYSACHWCHVMAHESFEDDGIAAAMNRDFVNIKVDREERPDVDQIYQHALALLGEQGGWPLTMFLTPEREPFWGGTYFPPEDRWGRPGFPRVLDRIAAIYRDEGDKVRANADTLKSALAGLGTNHPGGAVARQTFVQIADFLLSRLDNAHGGLSGAPKFPQCALFDLIWRAWAETGNPQYRNAVLLLLDRMSQGGIYDHLGGGYARYSTDMFWLAPHFEKMLYDNAQILELLAHAWADTGSALYLARAEETVAWLTREMLIGGRAFASALDADSEGEEGKFYVWSFAEIEGLLGDDAAAFCEAYDVSADGNWEGKAILNRSQRPMPGDAAHEAMLERCRAVLLEARAKRARPGLDDKVLADWNGYMIHALALAGSIVDRPAWIDLAAGAFDFVLDEMTLNTDSGGDRLVHSWRAGKGAHPATAEDYASLIRAALTLFEATGEDRYLDRAGRWTGTIDRHFLDPVNGGYFLAADDVPGLLVRAKSVHDNATPSSNGLMVHNLVRLGLLTGQTALLDRADTLVRALSGELNRNALAAPLLTSGARLLETALQTVVVGAADEPGTRALVRAAWQAPAPARVFRRIDPQDTLPDGHPAQGKGLAEGRPAAYVCQGATCSLPITEPAALTERLSRRIPA